jgi:muconate cycloisomerase
MHAAPHVRKLAGRYRYPGSVRPRVREKALTNARKVAAIAEAAGLSLFGGTMLESGVGTAASVQLFSTLATLRWGCQLFDPLLFKDDIAANRPEYRDFNLIVPNGPGFGVVVEEHKLAFYRRDGRRRERAA